MTSHNDMLARHVMPVNPRRGELRTGLSRAELAKLTIWRWRYAAEMRGLEPDHAVFAKYLVARGQLSEAVR